MTASTTLLAAAAAFFVVFVGSLSSDGAAAAVTAAQLPGATTTTRRPFFWRQQRGRNRSDPANAATATAAIIQRPSLVRDALENNRTLYYFGIGSNMLRSKLENRGVNGTKIEVLSMEAALVRNYRLAFNMRGFVPIEPGMGSLEPVGGEVESDDTTASTSRPLRAYHEPECHGALVELMAENYEKVMRSEGIQPNNTSAAGYEEIVVTAIPYDEAKRPVRAVALRARPPSRISTGTDPCPSLRYMTILREGAAELGLKPCYRQFLDDHPVQRTPQWLRRMAIHNLVFNYRLSAATGWRGWSRFQNRRLLFPLYVPTTDAVPRIAQWTSHVAIGFALLPGSLMGALARLWDRIAKQDNDPPFMKRMISMLEEEKGNDDKKKEKKQNDERQHQRPQQEGVEQPRNANATIGANADTVIKKAAVAAAA